MLAALTPDEKQSVAWGLCLGPRADPRRGWVECHAVGREDKHPSAGFDPKTDVYMDFGSATRLSFFDLAVALGAYATWLDALNAVGTVAAR